MRHLNTSGGNEEGEEGRGRGEKKREVRMRKEKWECEKWGVKGVRERQNV